MYESNDVTGAIVDCAFKLHVGLGPGLLESVYERVLAEQLRRRGFRVETQRWVSFEYDGMRFDEGLRLDMVVEDSVIVELKSAEFFHPVHSKQLLTYLRLSRMRVGLLLNFGAPTMKEGIKRVLNGF